MDMGRSTMAKAGVVEESDMASVATGEVFQIKRV
jgi:hypothetical protein